jgi:RHS repeat-associated protein
MRSYKAGPILESTTDYITQFVYQNGVLSFFGSPEGRVVNNSGVLEYQYAIQDHLSNTRVVFSSVNPTTAPQIATFENVSNDAQVFQNVNTSSTYCVTKAFANHTSGGQYSLRMNNTYPTGPAKSLKIFPGDVLDIEVYAYFEGATNFGGGSRVLNDAISSVANALTTGPVIGEAAAISSGVMQAYTIFGTPGNRGDTKPSAYLNYILLDKNYKIVDVGFLPVPENANMSLQKMSFPSMTIKEAGYMFAYLTYEGQGSNWVYFDDFKITHTKTNVIQYNDYYPFGLQASTSWTRDATQGNDYLANGGSELNVGSGWYEMLFRNYDPSIGRMTGIDPHASSYSPFSIYHYSFNNPILYNDPTGADGQNYQPPGPSDPWMSRIYNDFFNTQAMMDQVRHQNQVQMNDGTWVDKKDYKRYEVWEYEGGTIVDGEKVADEHYFFLKQAQQDSPLLQHLNESCTLDEFIASIRGMTYEQVVEQGRSRSMTRLNSQQGGPLKRYVRNPHDGNVIDMRHMLVVGYQNGSILGGLLEVIQYFDEEARPSSFNLQDLYSNELGSAFWFDSNLGIKFNPNQFSTYLEKFFAEPTTDNHLLFFQNK